MNSPTKSTTRCWVIAPVESAQTELFQNVWDFDHSNGLISIGWTEVGDYRNLSMDALRELVAVTFPGKPPQTVALISNMLWQFYHEIKVGDRIFARRGRMVLAAQGVVREPAFYCVGKNPYLSPPGYSHPNFLGVDWYPIPQNKRFETTVFPMHTVAEISLERSTLLLDESDSNTQDPESEPAFVDPKAFAFVLEKYLEDFIVSNFSLIFRDELRLYVDPEGNAGQQVQTDAGTIDILAIDNKSGDFVVIELKQGAIIRPGSWPASSIHGMG